MHTLGPVLVLAGAGSGKTRVITYRIARLIQDGVAPTQILAVTFTNKAAAEMRERVGHLASRKAKKGLTINTFHALGHKLLRECHDVIGLMPQFSIYDQSEQLGTIKRIFKDVKVDDRKFDAKRILANISRMKNANIAPDDAPVDDDDYSLMTKEVYIRYEAQLKREQAVDFDDLLLRPVRALREHQGLKDYYRKRFQFIMVDEYQDTNPIQSALLAELCPPEGNLCVVGDDDQAIYSFRGAEVGHILEFGTRFPGAKEIALTQNYRSTSHILNAANRVIANNQKRKAKQLWTSFGEGDEIIARAAVDDEAEAKWIAEQILAAHDRHKIPYENIAILYRSNMQSRPLEEALRFEHIPYHIVGGQEFFERKEVKDAACYLRLVSNPDDELSLRRIINYPPRGLGEIGFEHLVTARNYSGTSLYHQLINPPEDLRPQVREQLMKLHGQFEAARADFAVAADGAQLAAAARKLFDSIGMKEEIYKEFENLSIAARKLDNIDHLARSLEKYASEEPDASLGKFLGQLQLDGPGKEKEEEDPGVTLITIHGSKGLEWQWVFLAGLEEDLLPHKKTMEEAEGDIQEERRLCYVGITRARQRLFMSHAKTRKKYGSMVPRTVSRFLEELGDTVRRVDEDAGSDTSEEAQEKMAEDFFAKMRSKLGEF
jgi:superfamily I DNA/RNA helicase